MENFLGLIAIFIIGAGAALLVETVCKIIKMPFVWLKAKGRSK